MLKVLPHATEPKATTHGARSQIGRLFRPFVVGVGTKQWCSQSLGVSALRMLSCSVIANQKCHLCVFQNGCFLSFSSLCAISASAYATATALFGARTVPWWRRGRETDTESGPIESRQPFAVRVFVFLLCVRVCSESTTSTTHAHSTRTVSAHQSVHTLMCPRLGDYNRTLGFLYTRTQYASVAREVCVRRRQC